MAAIEKGLDLPPDPIVEQAVVAERLTVRRRPGSNYLLGVSSGWALALLWWAPTASWEPAIALSPGSLWLSVRRI